jgi:LuxR family maltose regulon positive regulatory protein
MTAPDNAGPLLETKLYVPRLRRGQVGRPRLNQRLGRGAEAKLTLVSAPAGFGKTTLLAEWLAAAPVGERSAAWLSLDEADNQPGSFWTYAVTALQTVAPGVGTPRSPSWAALSHRRSRRSSPACSTTSAPCRATSCWCSTTSM